MSRSPTRGAVANVAAFSNYASGGAKSFGSPFAAAAAANRVRTPSPEESTSAAAAAASEEEDEVKTQIVGQDEEEGTKAVSFGDRLRAGKDGEEEEEEKKKLELSEQECES